MKVTIELIDELRSRVNVTYDEAKRTLEKNDGDLVKSIIELEAKKGAKSAGTVHVSQKESFESFIDKALQLRLNVRNKDNEVLLNVPLVLAGLVFLMAFWVVIVSLVIAIVYSCKIRIYKANKYTNVNDIKQTIKQGVSKMKSTTEKIFEGEDFKVTQEDDDKDDDNEIIIE